jgi:DNA modification methylase
MRPGAHLCHGDARSLPLAEESVQCVVTSPPYWGLRDYGVADQLGLEPTPELYVAHMVEVFREVRRVCRADATVWLNLGDSYAASRSYQVTDSKHVNVGNHMGSAVPAGLKPKDLVGIPWRVAFALQADGWWLRSDIVWAKPNPMPESITDRPTKAHEYLFLLTKSARYYYDAEAIKEPALQPLGDAVATGQHKARDPRGNGASPLTTLGTNQGASGRNRRSVWTIATEPYPEAHFATFPEKLVEPCILAGTSERGACPTCGAPWGRLTERPEGAPTFKALAIAESGALPDGPGTHRNLGGRYQKWLDENPTQTLGWSNACDCEVADPVPCKVLDPFSGSGTTVAVAERLGRVGVGVELKPDYVALARRRTVQAGLL